MASLDGWRDYGERKSGLTLAGCTFWDNCMEIFQLVGVIDWLGPENGERVEEGGDEDTLL